MSCLQEWPEPIVRVQSLSDSGIGEIPRCYVKRPSDRPPAASNHQPRTTLEVDVPVIDLGRLVGSSDGAVRREVLSRISSACSEWGFFQVVNHGVSQDLMRRTRRVWREFFHQPLGAKQAYANSPTTYEGYGSRVGVEKGAILDWSDYFFLYYLPERVRNADRWPSQPSACRAVVDEYCCEVVSLCEGLMKILSLNLGLGEDHLQNALGGKDVGATLRVNFYPKCPQPDLTLGLSPHSDPGSLTILLPDEDVSGLQVRKDDEWVTVKPIPGAFVVNIGDQIQVLSNTVYKSVEHRVIVNSARERLSLALFYNPKGDFPIEPIKELVTVCRPALYKPMTFDEYRVFIRTKGPSGKSQVESLKSPT